MKVLLKKMKSKLLNIYALIFSIALSSNVTLASRVTDPTAESLEPIADMVRTYAAYCSAFVLVLALLAFVYNIIRLGTAGTNSAKREMAIRGLMLSGAAGALVPISTSLVFFLLNMF